MASRNRRCPPPPRNFAEVEQKAREEMARDIDGPREPTADEWLARVVNRRPRPDVLP
jgi:hypothetical protein